MFILGIFYVHIYLGQSVINGSVAVIYGDLAVNRGLSPCESLRLLGRAFLRAVMRTLVMLCHAPGECIWFWWDSRRYAGVDGPCSPLPVRREMQISLTAVSD